MTSKTTVQTTKNHPVARPLKVLVPLIRKDIKSGDQAARSASMPFYRAAGYKMLEAKESPEMTHGQFTSWIEDELQISYDRAKDYMGLVKAEKGRATPFSSINEFHKVTGNPSYMPNKPRPQPWHEPVKEAVNKVNVESLKQDALARQEERALQRKLALSLIDIGYKALASKLHPDKGGSREAMIRLNRVRELLKGAVT